MGSTTVIDTNTKSSPFTNDDNNTDTDGCDVPLLMLCDHLLWLEFVMPGFPLIPQVKSFAQV